MSCSRRAVSRRRRFPLLAVDPRSCEASFSSRTFAHPTHDLTGRRVHYPPAMVGCPADPSRKCASRSRFRSAVRFAQRASERLHTPAGHARGDARSDHDRARVDTRTRGTSAGSASGRVRREELPRRIAVSRWVATPREARAMGWPRRADSLAPSCRFCDIPRTSGADAEGVNFQRMQHFHACILLAASYFRSATGSGLRVRARRSSPARLTQVVVSHFVVCTPVRILQIRCPSRESFR